MFSQPLFLLLGLAIQTMATQPKALVYRGPAACSGCPEAVAHILRTSSSNFSVTYVGPNETAITAATLAGADIYAQPGGGSVSQNWPHLKANRQLIRDFVANGGIYLGFCLGAYFAGTPGYQLLPVGDNTNEETTQPGAQVTNWRKNTVIQVDWEFHTGPKAGTTEKRWIFFQDGAVMFVNRNSTGVEVLGRYSSNGDVEATLNTFGKGIVATTGAHPEADITWYNPPTFVNPDGINFDIAWDFVETAVLARHSGLNQSLTIPPVSNSTANGTAIVTSPSSSSSRAPRATTSSLTHSNAAATISKIGHLLFSVVMVSILYMLCL